VVTTEKHDERSDASAEDSVLIYAQEEVAASHFTGHLKVTHDVSHDGIGAAPHSTRDCERQGAVGFDYSTEKHEVQETITGHTTTRSMGEEKDTIRRGNAPHHRNWQQQVLTVTSRTDNGAVHNFARTDLTEEVLSAASGDKSELE
jgi:hypothetical protein